MSEQEQPQEKIGESGSSPFDSKHWPPVSLKMTEMVEDWVRAHVPIWKPGDKSDDALAAVAFHAGMKQVAAKMRSIHDRQQKKIKETAIRTSTQP